MKTEFENVKKEIGKNIKILRIHKDLSQEELAYKADIHTTHLSKIENGKMNVTIEILYKIAESLDTELSELVMPYKTK
ncbi:MAG: helix-turn-helix domain-containing protein [Candidatus Muirbacterium halophilum]|nr:helix-turn-helix domain-containing protein [Candidatus Muirbacterium halophilum]